MTFDELLQRYENATPAERQRVLDLLPSCSSLTLSAHLWETALRDVFESKHTTSPHSTPCEMCGHVYQACNRPNCHRLPPLSPGPEKTAQGWNLVLPGTERTAAQAVKARGAKIRPMVSQKDPGGMFEGFVPLTLDLFS